MLFRSGADRPEDVFHGRKTAGYHFRYGNPVVRIEFTAAAICQGYRSFETQTITTSKFDKNLSMTNDLSSFYLVYWFRFGILNHFTWRLIEVHVVLRFVFLLRLFNTRHKCSRAPNTEIIKIKSKISHLIGLFVIGVFTFGELVQLLACFDKFLPRVL